MDYTVYVLHIKAILRFIFFLEKFLLFLVVVFKGM